ncbi:DUF6044 family protein [Virgibacillus kimchii]
MSSIRLKLFTKHNIIIGIGLFIIILYLMPYYILGVDTHIREHDNLDSNIVWYKLLAESGQIFTLTDTTLPNVINGLPRSTLPSGLDAMVWLYVLFEPMTAYTIGQTIMRFAAFIGMYLLLKRHIIREGKYHMIVVGASVAFAMLPYWPSGMLSIAGLPLALHIFLTIKKRGRETPWYYWLTLLLIPFFSNFVLTFVFFLAMMGGFWLFDWIRRKRPDWIFFTAVASMTAIYVVKEYLLIFSMFLDDGFVSHREEMSLGHNSFQRSIELSFENFLFDHTHDLAEHIWVIVPVIGVAFIVAAIRKLNVKLLFGLFIFNFALSVWYAFWYWEGWRVVKDNFSIANTFNFARIHFFDPPIWYISFALALVILWMSFRYGKVIVISLLILQCAILFGLNEESKYSVAGSSTFQEFYSEELFAEVQDYIGMDPSEYRVVSIGMHPTIAQYNGFYTLDTYNNSFPLEYKHDFREVIAGELEKSPSLKNYFDTWGGRLYMYVAEHGQDYMFTKDREEEGTIEELDINTDALKELGGDYILSAVPIENSEETGLELQETFEHRDSPFRIRLYEVV